MLVQISVEVLLPGTHIGLGRKDLGHGGARRHASLLLIDRHGFLLLSGVLMGRQ
jgi:hypothetical protein